MRLLRPISRLWALLILRGASAYFKRQLVAQKVWVQGKVVTINSGRIESTAVKRNGFGEPAGLTLFYASEDDPDRKLRVDLTELKYDHGGRQWHFFRVGTPDPNPRTRK